MGVLHRNTEMTLDGLAESLAELKTRLYEIGGRNRLLNYKVSRFSHALEELTVREITTFASSARSIPIEGDQAALRRNWRQGRNRQRESGSDDLHLLTFFIHWYGRIGNTESSWISPLFIGNACIERQKDLEDRYLLRLRSDEWIINPVLAFCWSESGLELPQSVPAAELNDFLEELKDRLLQAHPPTRLRDFEPGIQAERAEWLIEYRPSIDRFNYPGLSLVRDYEEILLKPELVEACGRLGERSDTRVPEAVYEGRFDHFNVLADDASQEAAIRLAASGRSFGLIGPPGTGKSQTIVNLMAAALSKGKRVLLVSEKRTALDVVHQRLRASGLGPLVLQLHDPVNDKAELPASCRPTYELFQQKAADPYPLQRKRKELLDRMHSAEGRLSDFAAFMSGKAERSNDTVAGLFRRLMRQQLNSIDLKLPYYLYPAPEFCDPVEEILTGLSEGLAAIGEDALGSSAYAQVDSGILAGDIRNGSLGRQLGELIPLFEELAGKWEDLQAGDRPVKGPSELDELYKRWNLLEELDRMGGLKLLRLAPDKEKSLQNLFRRFDRVSRSVMEQIELNRHWINPLRRNDLANAIQQMEQAGDSWLTALRPQLRNLRQGIRDRFDFDGREFPPTELQACQELMRQYELEDELTACCESAARRFGIRDLPLVRRQIGFIRDRMQEERDPILISMLDDEALGSILERLSESQASFEGFSRFRRKYFLAAAEGSWSEWLDRLRQIADKGHKALPLMARMLELEKLQPDVLRFLRTHDCAPAGLCIESVKACLHAEMRAHPEMAATDRKALLSAMKVFHDCREQLHALNAQLLLNRSRETYEERYAESLLPALKLDASGKRRKKSFKTAQRILLHEFRKVRSHRPVREMLESEAGEIIAILKPLVLMSPKAVSEALALEKDSFDLLIFDEASQLRVQDCIPSIARSRQMIVVGDPQQLAPSDFFRVQSEDTEASLLDAVAGAMPELMLEWHYRSQHPALMEFSNRWFYAGRLRLPPPNGRKSDDCIKWHRLLDASRTDAVNRTEAEALAGRLRELICDNEACRESIGIACLSVRQAAAIESAIEQLAMKDPAFSTALESQYDFQAGAQFEGLFIKNLEQLQGDERDCMLISIGLSSGNGAKIGQQLGPLSRAGGDRRLNVLFSRARKRMEIFCSVDPLEIRSGTNEGADCLRSFLLFAQNSAENGIGSGTHSETDADWSDWSRSKGMDGWPEQNRMEAAILFPECGRAWLNSACSGQDQTAVLLGLGRLLQIRNWEVSFLSVKDAVLDAAKLIEELSNQNCKE